MKTVYYVNEVAGRVFSIHSGEVIELQGKEILILKYGDGVLPKYDAIDFDSLHFKTYDSIELAVKAKKVALAERYKTQVETLDYEVARFKAENGVA